MQRLAADAAHIVLFPRPKLQHDMRELLGVDIERRPGRYTVVPGGRRPGVSAAAAAELERPGTPGPALAELDALVAALPEHRRRLPLVISVGRLHRVKGMATLVEAWAGEAELRERCNLLIVGGDLERPVARRAGAARPDRRGADAGNPAAAAGLLLPGHRPNDVVARLAGRCAGRAGRAAAPGGVYVCSSLKEEFGLALVEALASGLVVVGPTAADRRPTSRTG